MRRSLSFISTALISMVLVSVLLLTSCTTYVLPPMEVPPATATQNKAIVVDIDGTLTPTNMKINTVRSGAVDALNAFSQKGYQVIYLSARLPFFQGGIPDWLEETGFPKGPLHTAQGFGDHNNPDTFKLTVLEKYTQAGWILVYGYGDSSTDFTAYAQAKIPVNHIFALQREEEEDCLEGDFQTCMKGWIEHLPFVEALPELAP